MVILLVMVAAFICQLVAQILLGPRYYDFLCYFIPSPATVLGRPWTLFTSIFLHLNFLHLLMNGVVLFFFAPMLEMRIGRRRFLYVFLVSGVLAGVAQLLVIPADSPILGASGAIMGVLGVLTALAPNLPVLLFFFIPMRLWMVTLGFGALSAVLVFAMPESTIGNMAHLAGLVVGFIYGYKLRREERKGYRYLLRFSNPWI